MQKVNEKAAENLAIATLVTGPVGSGKTMMMTSMAIDIEMQFRFQAFEIIKNIIICSQNSHLINLKNGL